MKNLAYIAIASITGIIILLGYFIRLEILLNLRSILLGWAGVLMAVALLVGLVNLFSIHWNKLVAKQRGSFYSLALILSMGITLIVGGWFGLTHPYTLWIFNNFQVPVEGSLLALLTVILVLAVMRFLRHKSDLVGYIFLFTAVLVGLVNGPLFGLDIPGLSELRNWMLKIPVLAGIRGILLGVGLGIMAAGSRILVGSDRPYEG